MAMKVDVKKAVGFQSKPQKVVFNSRDLMLYALSVGVRSPETELHFLYENDPNFSAFPTYPLVLGFKRDNVGVSVFDAGSSGESVPGIPEFDPSMALHGDQSLEIYRPLPAEGSDNFELHSTITGVYDKGKGMVIERSTLLVDPKEPQNPYSKMTMSAFIRGAGGWGGDKGPKVELNEPPKDKLPYAAVEEQTSEDQAILYRLSGDYNPLHIDPAIASMVGFKKPILHGLCTYGHAAHAILREFGGSDPNAFKSISGRFTAPTFPGDTLQTKMWKVPAGDKSMTKILFQCVAKERGVVVINAGCVVLQNPTQSLTSKL
ncbi:hypothetical protein EMPS_01086 [Entomortierella parvispora]|uniref:MaoC-like domain-containing protein n=1 Tax=Entomortierella parvispora TaxID=205924 RepID=A0A9P3LSL4_9FUNG|nr:hypothetical protein EMPS_01086 [Entomortierella parvispora]